ncbi:helix-turn-helix domain-containing protein [Methylobacterium organophilum]|uniref:helix-turn-helix domain-containing protein n=1 Tax=Methylobacterium organophilum TaxID=410 RepID=UPI001EE223D5|nr:helix-turn-helix transcriptional regulator [Methylobacterium organophilum]UMY18172.1 helix-turn-helix domain-containing protein [Methylobacterium organophilum]
MATVFEEIGRRLRAYRIGSGRTAEELARDLGVSRALVYKIEAGEVIKIETLDRLSTVLGTSMASLLGVGVEYYSSALGYFERMRQVEEESDQVIAHFPPISYLLSSDQYKDHLRKMLVESLGPEGPSEKQSDEIDAVIAVLNERKAARRTRHFSVVNFVTVPEIERFLRLGVVGRFDLPEDELARRRIAARLEIEHLLRLIESEPMGVQIALIEETLPNVTFQLFKGSRRTMVGLSPFRLGGELPNIRTGVATLTADEEPVRLYESLTADLWQRAHKGSDAVALLRTVLDRSGEPDSVRLQRAS